MLPRVLEAEVMDTPEEARDYDAMDHGEVNRVFVADFLQIWNKKSPILDIGTGTAQIPIEFCRQSTEGQIIAGDLAEHMLKLARENVKKARVEKRVQIETVNARAMPFPDGCFPALMSNSIVHHIAEPRELLAEIVRVTTKDATIFLRDLLRPDDEETLANLVRTYAGQENDHQRQMFQDSLRAALTLTEMRELVVEFGFEPESVRQTSDRHWTWAVASR